MANSEDAHDGAMAMMPPEETKEGRSVESDVAGGILGGGPVGVGARLRSLGNHGDHGKYTRQAITTKKAKKGKETRDETRGERNLELGLHESLHRVRCVLYQPTAIVRLCCALEIHANGNADVHVSHLHSDVAEAHGEVGPGRAAKGTRSGKYA